MRNLLLFSALACTAILSCSRSPVELAGGSTSTPNEVVLGCVVFPTGAPAARTEVRLIPSSYAAIESVPSSTLPTDTTDESGTYRFAHVDTGIYNIQAVHLDIRTRALITGIAADKDTVYAPPAVLEPAGNIIVIDSDWLDSVNGHLYIPGTTNAKFIDSVRDTLVLDSVPAGLIHEIAYSSINGTTAVTIRYNVHVVAGDTAVVRNPSWKHARSIGLNTSATGADIQGDVYGFPVLVRLSADAFDFAQAKTGGEDIRFTSSNDTPLPYEIEQWDAAGRRAAIWVRVDKVNGNDSTQSIIMYWGNQAATDSSSSTAVFDTAAGFQGVWHFSDGEEGPVCDATVNGYHGTSPGTARPSIAEGVVGNCRVFDGVADYITMPNTADSKLNFPEEGYYTLCAWVSLDTFDDEPHLIVAKGFTQYHLRFTYFPSNSPVWEFVEFSEGSRWQACTTSATSRQWTLLTGVREGSRQLLYCNGVFVDSTPNSYRNDSYSRNTSNDLSIGKFLKANNIMNFEDSYCFFKGCIDEVRILNAAQSPDWVRLCYMNQRAEDRLVAFK
jgi:hypothetical protein